MTTPSDVPEKAPLLTDSSTKSLTRRNADLSNADLKDEIDSVLAVVDTDDIEANLETTGKGKGSNKKSGSSGASSRAGCCPSWKDVHNVIYPDNFQFKLVDESDIKPKDLQGVPPESLITFKNGLLHSKPVDLESIEYWDICFVFPEEISANDDNPSESKQRVAQNQMLTEEQVDKMWEAIFIYKSKIDDVGVNTFYNLGADAMAAMSSNDHKRCVFETFVSSLKLLGIETSKVQGSAGETLLLCRMYEWAAETLARDTRYPLQLDRWVTTVSQFREDSSFVPPYVAYEQNIEDHLRGWEANRTLGRVFTRYDKVSRTVLLKEFDKNNKEVTLLRDVDRARLTVKLLSYFFNLSQMKSAGYLKAQFVLHQENNREYLDKNWARFMYMSNADQPISSIRSYFGEENGFWFSWLAFFCARLWLPAIIGIGVSIVQLAIDPQLTFTNSTSNAIGVAYAAYIVLWTMYYQRGWNKQEEKHRMEWGMEHDYEIDVPRPDFKYDSLQLNPGNPTGPPLKKSKTWKTVLRYSFTTLFSSLFMALVVAVVCAIFTVQVVLWRLKSMSVQEAMQVFSAVAVPYFFGVETNGTLLAKIDEAVDAKTPTEDPLGSGSETTSITSLYSSRREPNVYSDLATSSMIAVLVFIFEKIWRCLAVWLCNVENHQFEASWKNSLALKFFFFGVINDFNYLMFVAFVKPHVVTGICPTAGCMGSLRVSAMSLVVVYFLLNIASTGLGMLCASRRYHKRKRVREARADDVTVNVLAERLEKQYNLEQLGTHDQTDKWNEMALQLWLISLFSVAFPGIGFLAWVFNMFKLRLEAYTFTKVLRRPFPGSAGGIGVWKDLMALAQPASIAVNCALCVFNLPVGGSLPTLWKFLAFILVEHVLLTCLAGLLLNNRGVAGSIRLIRDKGQAVLNEAMWGTKDIVELETSKSEVFNDTSGGLSEASSSASATGSSSQAVRPTARVKEAQTMETPPKPKAA
eukprot:GHVN01020749.1.p1 GENE.GHVN01020749.1~~GHVN01020749.1.p1  ORF type:complete len:975 (-),score=117.77 GHVN01020749.1:1011-3935(-)